MQSENDNEVNINKTLRYLLLMEKVINNYGI